MADKCALCNPAPWRQKWGDQNFKTIVNNIASLSPAWTTKNPDSKQKKKGEEEVDVPEKEYLRLSSDIHTHLDPYTNTNKITI